jgi:hypothetical protein
MEIYVDEFHSLKIPQKDVEEIQNVRFIDSQDVRREVTAMSLHHKDIFEDRTQVYTHHFTLTDLILMQVFIKNSKDKGLCAFWLTHIDKWLKCLQNLHEAEQDVVNSLENFIFAVIVSESPRELRSLCPKDIFNKEKKKYLLKYVVCLLSYFDSKSFFREGNEVEREENDALREGVLKRIVMLMKDEKADKVHVEKALIRIEGILMLDS